MSEDLVGDEADWQYLISHIRELVHDLLPQQRLDLVWQRLLREGFDLDQVITSGQVDFGRGAVIDLELRVRGYAVEVLRACPINPGQLFEDEPEDSPFLARVRVQVPETGALLRWLLGFGDNVEVVAPAGLRQVMADQAVKMAGPYVRLSELRADAGGESEQGQALMTVETPTR